MENTLIILNAIEELRINLAAWDKLSQDLQEQFETIRIDLMDELGMLEEEGK
jgi:hypothetical protein